ncbi:ferritin [Anaerosphaera multitolerans]|nr:ferritin [Anaerosphaera multitolerans]
MSKLMEKMNEQFNFELSSGYIYLAMSAFLKDQDMDGFANFMYKQAEEEFEHAMKFYNFLFEIDETPEYDAMEKPKAKYESFTEVFETAYEHEKEVSRRIRELYAMAQEEKNYEVIGFLGWFIEEQIEEEDSFRTIVNRLKRIDGKWNGLYIFDRELGQRE